MTNDILTRVEGAPASSASTARRDPRAHHRDVPGDDRCADRLDRRSCHRSGDHRPCRGARLLRWRRHPHAGHQRRSRRRWKRANSSSSNTGSTTCCSSIPSRSSPSWMASPWAAAWACRSRRVIAWRPNTPALPCRRRASACSPMSAAAGSCRACRDASGQFLALTGARLDGAECHALGLATHYLPSDTLDQRQGADRRSIRTRSTRFWPGLLSSRRLRASSATASGSTGCSHPTATRTCSPR